MLKTEIKENIRDLLGMVSTMSFRQIMRFFSVEVDSKAVEEALREMTLRNEIKFDKNTQTFSRLGASQYEQSFEKRRGLALEVIAGLGSNKVVSVYTLDYPNLFEVCVLSENEEPDTYDYAVIESVSEAITAARYRANGIPKGVEDNTIHFAILTSQNKVKSLSKDLLNAGFDYACLIDPKTKEIQYFQLMKTNGKR